MSELLPYVVITPARNEAERIEQTMLAMLRQRHLPLLWLIVSDGSTDGTDEIVRRHAAQTPWIRWMRMPERAERHFAGKAQAFNTALASMRTMDFAAVACMDADVTFEPDYFAFLLEKLASDEKFGIIGTPYCETSGEIYDYRYVSLDEVSGICQLFRRTCVEEIGGYMLSKGGNIDTIACLSARMKGWKTRTFPEMTCTHLRTTGTAQHGLLRARFNEGKRDYLIGNHPLWQLFRMLYQMRLRPFLLRGTAIGAGYAWSALRAVERPVPVDLIAFRRKEQMQRLRRIFWLRLQPANSMHEARTR
jgi:glycosyltransferase involved in cell wall biosynthesis